MHQKRDESKVDRNIIKTVIISTMGVVKKHTANKAHLGLVSLLNQQLRRVMKRTIVTLCIGILCFAGQAMASNVAKLEATIKALEKQGMDTSAMRALLAEEKKKAENSGSPAAKKNYFVQQGYSRLEDCPSSLETQLYTMCANANLLYLQYLQTTGTSSASQAYRNHQDAAKVAIRFYDSIR